MMERKRRRAARANQSVPVAERESYGKRALVFNRGLRHMKVKRPSSEIYRPEFEMDGQVASKERRIRYRGTKARVGRKRNAA
jgi:hypothetical protein